MPVGVWVLGGFQSDFARNWSREGRDIADLFAEAVPAALETVGLAPADSDVSTNLDGTRARFRFRARARKSEK